MAFAVDTIATNHVVGASATYAYRDFGKSDSTPPLVLLTRYKGTMDHWDPAFLDILAAERRVILFDNAGVSESTGVVAEDFAGMAETAVDFVKALGLEKIDVLGWSIGGFIAQMIALNHPDLVRRLLVLGSGPGGVPGSPPSAPRVGETMVATSNTDEDYLYLFFGESDEGRRLGLESLRRLDTRLSVSHAEVDATAWGTQLGAIMKWASGQGSAWERLHEIRIPTLVANGAHDVMVPSEDSFAMSKRLTNAETIIYSDAGHGFLFQHPEKFGNVVLDFLS